MNKKGILITIEGGDGSGKSSLSNRLYKELINKGHKVIQSREPGGTIIGEKIRNILLDPENDKLCDVSEALLYASARAQLVNEVITPKLNEGYIIICDRFIDSSIIYQGICRNLGVDFIKNINRFSVIPNITFVLSLEYEEGIKRLKSTNKNPDRIERNKALVKYVYDIYNTYIDSDSAICKNRLVRLDSNRNIDNITNDAMGILSDRFKL